MENKNTMIFSADKQKEQTILEILETVYSALEHKGYDPIDQIVGYIGSGDPSYITGHNNARNLIRHIGRDDLVEELLRAYLKK
jgi:uncharacterized protein (UPF0297 family)